MSANREKPDDFGNLFGTLVDLPGETRGAAVDSAKLERLRRLMSPLECDVADAPPGLARRVIDRIEAARLTIPIRAMRRDGAELQPGTETSGGAPLLTLREVIGLAAAIAVFVGIFVPGYQTARRAALRTACLNNVRAIGGGYAVYQAANADQLPFAGASLPGASWLRTDEPGVLRTSNSRHVFQLVRRRMVDPNAFHCPGRPHDYPLNADAVDQFEDFPDPRNNSYATILYPERHRGTAFQSGMPLLADMNPMIDGGRRVDGVRPGSNSRSHAGPAGQHVLRADGSAAWTVTPQAGPDGDDIYHIAGVNHYRGFENPRSQTDAFLIP